MASILFSRICRALILAYIACLGISSAEKPWPIKNGAADSIHSSTAKEAAPPADSISRLCIYSVKAFLDDASYQCRGRARIRQTPPSGKKFPSIDWQLDSLKCSGDPSADWMHQGAKRAGLTKGKEGWQPAQELPGNSICQVTGLAFTASGAVDTLEIDCEWKCRSEANPCEGNATYSFHCPRN